MTISIGQWHGNALALSLKRCGDIPNRMMFFCRLSGFCQVKQQSLDLLKRRDEKDDLVEPDPSMKSWRHCEEWKHVTDCDNGDIQIFHFCFNLRGALGLRLANIEEQADSLRWWFSGRFWLDCRCSPSSRSWHRFLSWGRNRGSEKDVGAKNWSKVTTSCRNGSQNPEAYKYLGWRWSTNIQELHKSMTQLFILVLSSCPRLDVWCREHVVKLSNTWQSQGEAYCSIKFQARHPVFVNTSQIHHIHFSSADNGCV